MLSSIVEQILIFCEILNYIPYYYIFCRLFLLSLDQLFTVFYYYFYYYTHHLNLSKLSFSKSSSSFVYPFYNDLIFHKLIKFNSYRIF